MELYDFATLTLIAFACGGLLSFVVHLFMHWGIFTKKN